MNLNFKTISAHLIMRILCLPALVFAGCLLIKMTQTPDEFIHFLRDYRVFCIFSLIIIMTHIAQELITALEDYMPNPSVRAKGIKILLFLSSISVVIIGFTLWRI